MPQAPVDVPKYFDKPLPYLQEKYPPGTGGTGPRADWEGNLKGVEVIDDFNSKVKEYLNSLPKEPVRPNPYVKYPKIVQVQNELPNQLRDPSDLQKALTILPLRTVSSILTALEGGPQGYPAPQRLDAAGYESDGGEEDEARVNLPRDTSKEWHWRFSKSPLGSGELLLYKGDNTDDVKLIVRTINSSAFTPADWEEYVVTGPYNYNIKSKASWYWSRAYGASQRLGTKYWVLTDYQRWVFGKFDDDHSHGWVSPIITYDQTNPSVLQALFYWAETAIGEKGGFDVKAKDVSGMPALFPPNPARRVSVSAQGGKVTPRDPGRVRAANESDIEESDAEE